MVWDKPCKVTLILVRDSTGSKKEFETQFDGICINIPKEVSQLQKQGWRIQRTIPPQHEIIV